MGNLVLGTKGSYLLTDKGCLIIEDIGAMEPEATYDISPQEFDNLLSCDTRE